MDNHKEHIDSTKALGKSVIVPFDPLKSPLFSVLMGAALFPASPVLSAAFIAKAGLRFFNNEILESAKFCDVNWQELQRHIVLVHAINRDTVVGNLKDTKNIDLNRVGQDKLYGNIIAIKTVLTTTGEIGHHLKFAEKQFQAGEFLDRPHLHWAMNQLVQPNSGGGWEEAQIAVLEPLDVFEQSDSEKVFSATPYDTLTIGVHKLSKRSTLIIPRNIKNEILEYLVNYQGKIVTYDATQTTLTLRKVIDDVIMSEYPDMWEIVDRAGHKLSRDAHLSNGGFFNETLLKTKEGKLVVLLKGKNQATSQSLQQAKKSGKYVGLHCDSITYVLEDDKNQYYKALKRFKENPESIKTKKIFAGQAETPAQIEALGIFSAMSDFMDDMKASYANDTGAHAIADYVLNEALYADISSIFFKSHNNKKLKFSALELDLMIAIIRPQCFAKLSEIKAAINIGNGNLITKIYKQYISNNDSLIKKLYNEYCSILENIIRCCLGVRKLFKSEILLPNNINEGSLPENILKLLMGEYGELEWRKLLETKSQVIDSTKKRFLHKKQTEYYEKISHVLLTCNYSLVNRFWHSLHEAISRASSAVELQRLNFIVQCIKSYFFEKKMRELFKEKNINANITSNIARTIPNTGSPIYASVLLKVSIIKEIEEIRVIIAEYKEDSVVQLISHQVINIESEIDKKGYLAERLDVLQNSKSLLETYICDAFLIDQPEKQLSL